MYFIKNILYINRIMNSLSDDAGMYFGIQYPSDAEWTRKNPQSVGIGLQTRNQFSLAHMAVVGKHQSAGDDSNICLFGSDWTLVIYGVPY